MALTQVSSGGIKNATVATEDIANGAVSNAKIVDGAINNAKVVSDAAIAGSKVNPNFGSQALTCGSVDSNGGIIGASLQLDSSTVNYLYYTDSLALTKSGHGAEVTINSSGNVGIGTTTPDKNLHIKNASSGSSYSADGADLLIIENNDSVGIDLRSPAANSGNIFFSDANARSQGRIFYEHNNDAMAFCTNGVANERMRLNSDGDLLIGRTTTIDTSEVLGIKGPSGDHCTLGLTTDGTTNLGIIAFNDSDANFRGQIRYSHSNDTMQFQTANSERINISADGIKFNGDSAAANALDDYEEGTWQPEFDDAYFTSPGTTYNSRAGSYIKIGRMVLARFHVNFAGCSNSNAGPFISAGLPFTPDTSNISSRGLQGTVSFSGIDAPTSTINVNFGYHRLDNNVYYLGINSPRDNTTDGNGSTIQAGDISNGDTISGTVMYISAS